VTDRLDLALQHCADLGIDVEWRDLGPKRRGGYDWRGERIILSTRLTEVQAVCSLWHEIGHHRFGDRCSSRAAEDRAWQYAAAVLVLPDDYAAAERLVGCHENDLALHLGVTQRVIRSWRRWWETRGRWLPAHQHILDPEGAAGEW
jgi:hypothetical protein